MEKITIKGFVDGEVKAVELPILPTPLAKLMKAMPLITKGLDSEESVNALTEAVYHGVRRAKGEVTLEWLQENVDNQQMDAVFDKFLEVNGLQRKVKPSGEPQAGPQS